MTWGLMQDLILLLLFFFFRSRILTGLILLRLHFESHDPEGIIKQICTLEAHVRWP